MTKKEKLETFDAVLAERDKLRLAVFDLAANSKFPFMYATKINVAKEIDSNYPDHLYWVSVSERAMPLYMVRPIGYDGKIANVYMHAESELESHRDDPAIYWRMLRHAAWQITRKSQSANLAESA